MKLLWLLAAVCALYAQTFEVASVKPNTSGEGGSSIRGSAGRITMTNVPLRKVTLWANGIPDDRDYALVGPEWLATDRFDIQATFPDGATPEQVRLMTRALLAERFKLALHPETRQRTVYALVTAKSGPKMHAAENGQSRTSSGPGRMEATKINMQKLSDLLSRMLSQQVVDATNLKGVFDFTLEWSPEQQARVLTPDDPVPSNPSGPSLFSALQEQLGLKLESRKGNVEVLVVDHVERTPTGN